MGLKLATDVIGNKDYFGNSIYNEFDKPVKKLKDVAKYVGLSVNHPYVKGVYNIIQNKDASKKPIYPKIFIH
jgi:hypothetical protein